MAYIGQGIKQGTFKVLDTSGNTYNGSNTTFSLGTQVGAAAQLLVSHDGVIQKPGTDYTLASGGASITFSTAPASGASIFIVETSGAVGGTVTPSDASVTTDKLGADAVTEAKIADDAVESEHLNNNIISGQTALGETPADTDEFLVSDGGTIKRVDYSYTKGSSTIGGLTDVTVDKASVGSGGGNFYNSILIDPSTDGSAPNLNAVTGNANNNYGIGKDTFSALTSGIANVAIGEGAGKALTTGYSNVIIGGDAGDSMNTGFENVCVGVGSGSSIANGERNVAIGRNALNDQSGAGGSVAVGWDALSGANNSYATAIGYQAGSSGYAANSTYVGYQAYGSSNQNEIVISTGNPVGAGADTISIGKNGNRLYANFSSNNTWTQSSDERMKKNITDDTLGLSFINRLRPVTFNFRKASEYPEDFIYYDATNKNSKDDTITHHGLIAQEVKAAMDAESNTTFKGYDLANDGVHSISEGNFVYPLIKAVKELSAKVDALETENTALKARVTTLEG